MKNTQVFSNPLNENEELVGGVMEDEQESTNNPPVLLNGCVI